MKVGFVDHPPTLRHRRLHGILSQPLRVGDDIMRLVVFREDAGCDLCGAPARVDEALPVDHARPIVCVLVFECEHAASEVIAALIPRYLMSADRVARLVCGGVAR